MIASTININRILSYSKIARCHRQKASRTDTGTTHIASSNYVVRGAKTMLMSVAYNNTAYASTSPKPAPRRQRGVTSVPCPRWLATWFVTT